MLSKLPRPRCFRNCAKLESWLCFAESGQQRVWKRAAAVGRWKTRGSLFICQSLGTHMGAAVCIFEESNSKEPRGLARFIQLSEDRCFIDVTVDGLPAGQHGVAIHEVRGEHGCFRRSSSWRLTLFLRIAR
jgi:hypothetical protein